MQFNSRKIRRHLTYNWTRWNISDKFWNTANSSFKWRFIYRRRRSCMSSLTIPQQLRWWNVSATEIPRGGGSKRRQFPRGWELSYRKFFHGFFPSFKTITIVFIIYDRLNAFLHGFAIDSCHRLVYLAVAVLHNIIIVVFIVMLLGSRKDR